MHQTWIPSAGAAMTLAVLTAPAFGQSPAELEMLFRARADSARSRFVEADAAFMTGMIAHHAQALLMAGMAPTHGASASVGVLAARITNAQRDEIALMQRWLRERGRPVPEPHIEGTTLMVHGAAHGHPMPGMATEAELRALDEARAGDFDRTFLTLMIRHHRGAVVMVDTLIATPGAARDLETFRLAADIQADQRAEIARMERMLAALTATPARTQP